MQTAIEQLTQDEKLEIRLAFMLIPLAQVSRQQLEIMRGIDRAEFEPAVNAAIETARQLMAGQGGFTENEALTKMWDKYEVEVDARQLPSVFTPVPALGAEAGAVENKITQKWVLTPTYLNLDTHWTYDGSELDILPRWKQAQKE